MVNKEKITAESALRIIGFIRNFYKEQGLGEIGHVELHVLPDEVMECEFGIGVAGNACSDHVINVLRNTRPSQFAEIFAHELLHIWQFEHNLYDIEDTAREGFCNLGAYLFLERVGTPGAKECMQSLMDDPDPVYGDGFRMMLDVYRRSGWDGVIRILHNLN